MNGEGWSICRIVDSEGRGAVSVCPSVSCKIQKSKLIANKLSHSPAFP